MSATKATMIQSRGVTRRSQRSAAPTAARLGLGSRPLARERACSRAPQAPDLPRAPRGGRARGARLRRGPDGRLGRTVVGRAHRRATSPGPGSAATCAAMHAMLDARSRSAHPLPAFRRAYAALGGHRHARSGWRRASPRASATARCAVPVAVQHARLRRRPGTPARAGARTSTCRLDARASPSRALRAGERLTRRSRAGAGVAPRPRRRGAWPRGRRLRAAPRSAGSAASIAGVLEPEQTRGRPGRASTRAGSRATGRSGGTGSSARSSIGCPAVPAALLIAGDRVLASAEPRKAAADAHHDRHRPPGGRRGRAGRPARRHRRARPAHRRGPGARRPRLLRASAPWVDLQDHHDHRRPGGAGREAEHLVPGPDGRDRATA